ncbi:peptidoglycan-binding protein [Pelagivirga sediminicola]|uniref:Peptidoglycan-binding protein n=1 Tax=Pelagivirga sediminicola TaxID=2170575 RepID=A0A2T7G6M1_9RHOB|nr:serine protease [Pelagivirga sediminicola]PVA10062.1 peptidoglycan-binding protein [Pelagivirga sediminicola]
MIRTFLAAIFVIVAGLGAANAQQTGDARNLVWVQIEAQPNLAAINEALRRRAASLQDVNGFDLDGSGWFVVALGPYDPVTAENVLRTLRANGRIPADSYIAESADYARQIWPVGANLLGAGSPAASGGAQQTDPEPQGTTTLADALNEALTTQRDPAPEPEPEPQIMDETPREARASEAQLTRDERADLQIALEWAGHYQGRIDAQFGAGTRRSMASWQGANGYESTGILTTMQRAALLKQYNAVLEGLGLERVADPKAGIAMQIPLGVVKFAKYEPPFVHFDATGDIPARVLMISQEGTQDTLFGLYDIMQTLEIVPQDGPRERGSNSFTLTGANARIVSHTQARLENGQIKGFTLIWPAGDEERRTRLLALMEGSFTRTEGVLDPGAGYNDAQSIDLISGLEIRKPKYTRSGFYIDGRGTVVTTSQIADGCGHITIEDGHEADIAATDADLGVAILRPRDTLAPISVAALRRSPPRIQSEVTLAGYSYGGVLGAPSLTFGTLSDVRGLNGEDGINRLEMSALEGDVGGPVMDPAGAVLGMLLPREDGARNLPDDVAFVAGAGALGRVLAQAGMNVATASGTGGALAPAQMADRASGMTVLVSCWE